MQSSRELNIKLYTVEPLLTTTPDVRTLSLERPHCPKVAFLVQIYTPEIRTPPIRDQNFLPRWWPLWRGSTVLRGSTALSSHELCIYIAFYVACVLMWL